MKTVDEIFGEMAAVFSAQTGMDAGASGDLAVRLYAVAAEIFGLYVQAEWLGRQCFPQTAQGDYLDRHAQLRGISRKGAARAEGTLRFSVPAPAASELTIPAGTVCMTAGLARFETTREAALPAGASFADVPARAMDAGSAGNAAAGSILTMAVAPSGIAACSNPAAFSGGADPEDDESLRARVLDTYCPPSNGANAAYYRQTALSFDEVAAATVLPRSRGIGTVDVVIAAHAGPPGDDLLEKVRGKLHQAREIAVDVQVSAPTVKTVDVSIQVKTGDGKDAAKVRGAVESALRNWFTGKLLSQPVLRSRLGNLAFGVEGVENYVLSQPAADLQAQPGVLPVLGTLTVADLEDPA